MSQMVVKFNSCIHTILHCY